MVGAEGGSSFDGGLVSSSPRTREGRYEARLINDNSAQEPPSAAAAAASAEFPTGSRAWWWKAGEDANLLWPLAAGCWRSGDGVARIGGMSGVIIINIHVGLEGVVGSVSQGIGGGIGCGHVYLCIWLPVQTDWFCKGSEVG